LTQSRVASVRRQDGSSAAAHHALRVGLIGYGLAGRAFHAPLVEAVPGLELRSIVTSNEERIAAARSAHPGADIVPSADDLFAAGEHDLIVVAAPNRHHAPLGMAAIEAGLHVVIDKPLAVTADEGRRLAGAASSKGVVASVFHNRRWDGDFLTLRRLRDDGALGELLRFESRLERWRPEVDTGKWREGGAPEDAGGVLFDLGPHVIDQALDLLGPAYSLYAETRTVRPGAQVDDDFFIALEHLSGARSHLWATMVAAQAGPRMRALGRSAAYVKWGVDVQEDALRSGADPRDPGFGEDPPDAWGTLGSDEDRRPVQTEPGRYVEFYEQMERAIREGAPPPVRLEAGIATLEIIEAARRSARDRTVIAL
jgi:scyllo-inositol 2-dehydrogenase (NADP+)